MRRVTFVTLVVLAAALPGTAEAAAPDYILVTGPGVSRPVVLDSWQENHALLLAVAASRRATGRAASLTQRPRFLLALFWGWYDKPRPRSPRQANDRGFFYPAHRGRPAVIEIGVNGRYQPWLAPPRVLRLLGRHGVPVR